MAIIVLSPQSLCHFPRAAWCGEAGSPRDACLLSAWRSWQLLGGAGCGRSVSGCELLRSCQGFGFCFQPSPTLGSKNLLSFFSFWRGREEGSSLKLPPPPHKKTSPPSSHSGPYPYQHSRNILGPLSAGGGVSPLVCCFLWCF